MLKLTKENVTKVLIEIQDRGDITANSIATQAIKDFGLEKVHSKLTYTHTYPNMYSKTKDNWKH